MAREKDQAQPANRPKTRRSTDAARPGDGPNAAGVATRQRLIDTAERMFAHSGIDGVALKHISLASGLSNNYGAQYHFHDKDGLVSAILSSRFEALDVRRKALLAELTEAGQPRDLRRLLTAMFLPRIELLDGDGNNTFAKFLMEFRLRYSNADKVTLPFLDEDSRDSQVTRQLAALIRTCLTGLEEETIAFRIRSLSDMLDAALVDRDRRLSFGEKQPSREVLFQRILDMATAALTAPPADNHPV